MACCAVAAYIIFRLVSAYDRLAEPLIARQQRLNGTGKPEDEPLTSDRSVSLPVTTAPVAGTASCILSLGGLVCGTCVKAVQTALRDQPGVSHARTSLTLLRAYVTYDPSCVSPAQLIDAVRDAGYHAEAISSSGQEPWSELRSSFEASDAARLRDIAEWRRAFVASVVCSGLAVAASYASPWSTGTLAQSGIYVVQLLAAVVSMLASRRIHSESARAVWLGQRRNMSTLASLGICIGFAQSISPLLADGLVPGIRGGEGLGSDGPCFDGICVLASVVLGGRLVKAVVSRRTLGSGALLAALIPLSAHVVGEFDGSEESSRVPLDMVASGDCILVDQGERIPVDGVVRRCGCAGGAHVLESWMTGSVVPRRVEPGDFVFAGSLVSLGQLTITTKATGTVSRLGKTLERIAGLDAESNSPATTESSIAETLVDVILVLAAATTLYLRLACGMPWALCLSRGTAMLLAACPCAFSLSVPSVLLASTCMYSDGEYPGHDT
jgi:Cu+-exporting ATPase